MTWWCPWFARTGEFVRHKRTGKVGEIVYRHGNGKGDVEVEMQGGGLVTWFGENIEPAEPPR